MSRDLFQCPGPVHAVGQRTDLILGIRDIIGSINDPALFFGQIKMKGMALHGKGLFLVPGQGKLLDKFLSCPDPVLMKTAPGVQITMALAIRFNTSGCLIFRIRVN